MIKLKNILLEIGDGSAKPFEWRYSRYGDSPSKAKNFTYYFNADDEDQTAYEVLIEFEGNNTWDISLTAENYEPGVATNWSYSKLTGNGALRVMATVTEIMQDWLRNTYNKEITDKGLTGDVHPEKITFSTLKDRMKWDQRVNLFKAFIKKQLPGSNVQYSQSGNHQFFTIAIPESLQPKTTKKERQ